MHILPNISRSKDKQTKKFGQLIEYNMKYIFLEKSYRKYGEETSLRHFSGKLKIEHISGSIVYSFMFLLYPKLRGIEVYWK